MNDDRMDELLARGTRDYNEPGAVPREEMWTRIQAARSAARRGQPALSDRRRPSWVWASAAVAAGLILYAGIAIGRRLEQPATAAARIAKVVPVASPDSNASRKDTIGAAAGPNTPAATHVAAATQTPKDEDVIRQLHDQTRRTTRTAQKLALAAAPARDSQTNTLAYRLVVLQHLAGSEAMITAFRSSAHRGDVDKEIATWSRELLGTTRMLEASAVAQDPVMKRLLEDLDLVIAQITQYVGRGSNNPDDLDLIEQSINKRGVIDKLRSTLPGRNLPAGT
jgi:hypothetical protein